MIDGIIEFWRELPTLVRLPLDFFLTVIVMRGIVANEISNWLKERGIMKDGILHAIVSTGKRLASRDERKLAIFDHYKTHGHSSIVECHDGRCAIFS